MYIDPPGAGHHHTLVPYAGSLQQSQPLTLQTNVQTLNASGRNMPVFIGPVTQPTFHIHQAQPSIGNGNDNLFYEYSVLYCNLVHLLTIKYIEFKSDHRYKDYLNCNKLIFL